MLKIAYGIEDLKIIIAINVLLLCSSIYVYMKVDKVKSDNNKKQYKVQSEVADGLRVVVQKIEDIENNLIKENQNQIESVIHRLDKFEEKLISNFEIVSKLSAKVIELMERKEELDRNKMNDLIRESKDNNNQLIVKIEENKNEFVDSIREGTKKIDNRFDDFKEYKKDIESLIENLIEKTNKTYYDIKEQIKDTQEGITDNITDLSEDVQSELARINRNIKLLGDKNSEVAEGYHELWKKLSKSLGETTHNNNQFLVLLQDHYKSLKQIVDEL